MEVLPVTPERWPDLVELFGPNGASSGCWCMWFRVAPKTWSENGGAGNQAAMERVVAGGDVPGLIAYDDGQPVGWISVAPRKAFERIEGPEQGDGRGPTSPAGRSVWSVVCFFIRPGRRGQGVGRALLEAGIERARAHGADVLEAYPVERDSPSNADAFTGLRSMFEKAGFREVGRFDRWRAVPAASSAEAKLLVRPHGRPTAAPAIGRRWSGSSRAPRCPG